MRARSVVGQSALAALALLLFATLYVANGEARTRSVRWDGCTARPGDVRFTAADGVRLVGHRFGTGPVGIVLAHQSDGELCQWLPYAHRLARLGDTVFAFDFRGHGESQSANWHINNRYGGDVEAAVAWIRSQGIKKVFLLGASIGGSAVIDAAANTHMRIAGVISVSGAADLVNALAAVQHVHAPLLILAGADDTDFANDAHRLYRAAAATADKKITIIANSGSHGVDLVATSQKARNLIETFLRAH